MKVYKEKQFLIFELDDGKTVKYDFATKKAIGKRGKPVKNLCSQLNGVTMGDVIENCIDEKYAKFLRFVRDEYCRDYYCIENIGTILDKVPYYARYEQIFSAGIDDIINNSFSYGINDIPKALIKLCKTHNIKLSNDFLLHYKQNPDAYQLVYKLEYTSLTGMDVFNILTKYKRVKIQRSQSWWDYTWENFALFNTLIDEYGYTVKGLMHYLDYLKTYEAIEDMGHILGEIYDYANMMEQISNKFDKYPRHFLTTHKIACRNYNRLKQEFKEEEFKKRIDKSLEKTFGEYKFIYPDSTQDIKNESVQMNNCVSSYIDRVIDGKCHILFLRYKDSPDKSLVTIEVRDNAIVQALQKYNNPLTKEQQEIVDKWNKWRANKVKEAEREELKNAG